MCELHLDFTNYGASKGGIWDKEKSTLHLPEAGTFNVVIREYAKAKEILKEKQKAQTSTVNEIDKEWTQLRAAYKGVRWIWRVSGATPQVSRDNFVEAYKKGSLGFNDIAFPKVLEGGGLTYMEAFFYDPVKDKEGKEVLCHPQGRAPFGCFISAAGTPKIVAAQWKDARGGDIGKRKAAFGSTVYLHIYTEGLYGQDLKVLLQDTYSTNADLTVVARDADGDPIEPLSSKGTNKYFVRKVEVHHCNNIALPTGAVTGILSTDDGNKQDGVSHGRLNVQKCVFPVYIDPRWQFEGAGSGSSRWGDKGLTLELNPIVYHAGLAGGKAEPEMCVLTVSAHEATYNEQEVYGNSPVLVSPGEMQPVDDGRKRIDFTFGVFIDGTLNNMYNTEARQAFEQRTRRIAGPRHKVKDIDRTEEKYRYEKESSYENDLSNPAIIYKSYIEDRNSSLTHKRYSIYTEGIGTQTKPDEQGKLEPEQYRKDDTIGYAFGTTGILANTGIRRKVRDAIELVVKQLMVVLGQGSDTIGTLTIDVFGFSRGAAAARHFVDEITYPEYYTNQPIPYDRHGYLVHPKYLLEPLPTHGHLGLLLASENKTFDHLDIRFAGLYDTVPHHGLDQGNDIADLGLDNINRAKYVVHLVADDEHRANFSLVDISTVAKVSPESGKKGGIELYLPGVHCDVGGSYVEGREEKVNRIEASFSYEELRNLKEELVKHGWFKEGEIGVYDYNREVTDDDYIGTNYGESFVKLILNAKRNYLSNQYSFIPLNLMVDFCLKKSVAINNDLIDLLYSFKPNIIQGNIEYLKRIEQRLNDYATGIKGKLVFEELQQSSQPGTEQRNNTDLIFLRNHYLHWNSAYGHDSVMDVLTQTYHPNKENGKRKREVR